MTTSSGKFVGVDVSKDQLDVAVLGEEREWQVDNTEAGIAELVKQLQELGCQARDKKSAETRLKKSLYPQLESPVAFLKVKHELILATRQTHLGQTVS